ncbi:hypothetical protein LSTR_LSTR000241 [Laodelphax striatellus]|uniref:Uncharacterized protein n=1 Tax=Laodelphax striatellus TaxID=195883 RepID=A0A482X6Y2_LAOST|nr:hypothetical protein LSTR_LSTR000241 [Laodelphax striatellus]
MGKDRHNKNKTAKQNDKGGKENDRQSRKEDGALEDIREEEKFQIENNENEQENDKNESLEHSQSLEIKKSRRSNLDVHKSSTHIMKILEKKRSDRDAFLSTTECDGETIVSESGDPDKKALNEQQGQVNPTGDENKADHKISDQETNNSEDENFSQAFNADVSNEKSEQNPKSDEDAGGISVYPNKGVSNRSLEHVHSVESAKSEEEIFFNSKQERKTLPRTTDLILNNQSMNEKEVLVNNSEDALDTKPEGNLNEKEKPINPENNPFNRQLERSYESEEVINPSRERVSNHNNSRSSSTSRSPYMRGEEEKLVVDPDVRVMDRQPEHSFDKSGKQINADSDVSNRPSESGRRLLLDPVKESESRQSITSESKNYSTQNYKILEDSISNSNLDEKSVNNYTEAENDAWNKKSQQGLNKGEEEILVNADGQRESFRLSSSKFVMPQNTKNEREISDNQGCDFNYKKSDSKSINPNEERVSYNERGSAVKLTDHNASKGSDDKTPVKCLSHEKIKMIDVVLSPSHADSTNSSLKTGTMKTSADKTDAPTISSTTPVQRKKEVIRINKELAPAVMLLLKKLEQCQPISRSAPQIKQNANYTEELKRQKSLDNSVKEQKQHRDPIKDMADGPEPEKRGSSSDKLNLVNGDRHVGETEGAEDKSVVTMKSSRATSTSTLHCCSSSKCHRTCKRCSNVKRINQKQDSPQSRRGNSQEDFDIAPTLEALAEKFKNGLKVGCSLLKKCYHNQNLVRVCYFQTHPGGGDLDEEP